MRYFASWSGSTHSRIAYGDANNVTSPAPGRRLISLITWLLTRFAM